MLQPLLREVQNEFPSFRIVPKEGSFFMKSISCFLFCLTLGGMRGFMTNFITVVGTTVYTHKNWGMSTEISKSVILRHERVHMRQRRKYGAFLFAFLYLFFPVPCVFSYFRMKFEMEAYAETIKALVELSPVGARLVQSEAYREYTIKFFTGAAYFWTWPFRGRIERWYDQAVRDALASTRKTA